MNSGKKYYSGLNMKQFWIIPEISSYNNNYYIGFDGDLLFAKSDDENNTEWYLIDNGMFDFIGESFTSKHDRLLSSKKGW